MHSYMAAVLLGAYVLCGATSSEASIIDDDLVSYAPAPGYSLLQKRPAVSFMYVERFAYYDTDEESTDGPILVPSGFNSFDVLSQFEPYADSSSVVSIIDVAAGRALSERSSLRSGQSRATEVPEPGAFGLLLVGLLSAGLTWLRRSQAQRSPV